MQITIQAAISVDGFICTPEGDSGWVKDDALFEQTAREYGCICLGNTTFTQYQDELYPMEGIEHIVLSTKPRTLAYSNVHVVRTVEQAIAKAKDLGFDRLLVIGGSQTNGSFMHAGVVDALLLDVHHIALGVGKKLLGDFNDTVHLRFVSMQQHEDFVSLSYDII
jgi:dihydrofolate reductase